MTPTGRVHPLDDHTEAIYLFGQSGGRTPGWYLRTRSDGGTGRITHGPFGSCAVASDFHQADQMSGVVDLPRPPRTPEEILSEAVQYVRTYRTCAEDEADEHGYQRAGPADGGDGGYRVLTPRRLVLCEADRRSDTPYKTLAPATNILVVRPRALIWATEPTVACRLDAYVKLEAGEGMVIGPHVHVASYCHLGIGGGITILEEGSSCGSGAKLISGSNVPSVGHGCSAIAPDAVVSRSFVWLRKNATVFAGGIVLPGTVVGEGACVAAGAVVLANTIIPAGEVWGGVPAKRIGVVR